MVPATKPGAADSQLAKAFTAAGLADYVAGFADKGYDRVTGLGDDSAAATQAIAAVVPDTKPGIRKRVLDLWKAAQPQAAPSITTLGAGKTFDLDMSGSTVSVEGKQFTIPDIPGLPTGATDGTAWIDAVDKADWIALARKHFVLHGLRMDIAMQTGSDTSSRAAKAALLWAMPAGSDFVIVSGEGRISATLAYSEEMRNVGSLFVSDSAADLVLPYVNISAKVLYEESEVSASATRTVHTTGRWSSAYGTLVIDNCTVVNPAFVAEVKAALVGSDEQRRQGLVTVFDRYGTVLPTRVSFGATMYFTSEETVSSASDEAKTKVNTKLVVGAKFDQVSAAVGSGVAGTSDEVTKATEQSKQTIFVAVGGDPSRNGSPKDWIPTTKDPRTWAVIDRSELRSVVDWLPGDLRTEVLRVWHVTDGKLLRIPWASPAQATEPFVLQSTARTDRLLAPRGLVGRVAPTVGSSALADPYANAAVWCLEYTSRTSEPDGSGSPLFRLVEVRDAAGRMTAARARDIAAATSRAAAAKAAGLPDSLPAPGPDQVALSALKAADGKWYAGYVSAAAARSKGLDSPAVWAVQPAGDGFVIVSFFARDAGDGWLALGAPVEDPLADGQVVVPLVPVARGAGAAGSNPNERPVAATAGDGVVWTCRLALG